MMMHSILHLLLKNIKMKNSALLVKRNDKVVYSVNPNVVLPVASTMKLIVALEYTKQVTEGKLIRLVSFRLMM